MRGSSTRIVVPTIGDPSADKILLFAKTAPVAGPIPSKLRVRTASFRFGEEKKNYAASYRSVQGRHEPSCQKQ
jgi:hypothetical protein